MAFVGARCQWKVGTRKAYTPNHDQGAWGLTAAKGMCKPWQRMEGPRPGPLGATPVRQSLTPTPGRTQGTPRARDGFGLPPVRVSSSSSTLQVRDDESPSHRDHGGEGLSTAHP